MDPSQFDGLLTYVRNILIVNIDPAIYTKASVSYENDRWANGQVVVTLNAPSPEAIIEYTEAHPKALVDFFVKTEMNRAMNQLQKDYSTVVMDNLKIIMT